MQIVCEGLPVDSQTLVYSPRHHAGPREQSVMNGVGGDEGIATLEVDIDNLRILISSLVHLCEALYVMTYDKIVYVVEVIPDLICREFSKRSTNDEVTAGSIGNLVRDMRGYMELTIIPTEFEPLSMQVDVVALCIGQKISFL